MNSSIYFYWIYVSCQEEFLIPIKYIKFSGQLLLNDEDIFIYKIIHYVKLSEIVPSYIGNRE